MQFVVSFKNLVFKTRHLNKNITNYNVILIVIIQV